MIYAEVVGIENNRLKLRLRGESLDSQVPYFYLDSYTPSIGDVVLLNKKLKIVIGRVVM